MNTDLMFSSATDQWATPQDYFDSVAERFTFTLDPCALSHSRKTPVWFGPDHPNAHMRDGLALNWCHYAFGGDVWMNPPYGRTIRKWLGKAVETAENGTTVVGLLPARTDTGWFHGLCLPYEVTFIRGRLKFGGHKNAAPFPSMLVVWRPS